MTARLSVVVPAYNVANYIGECLDPILACGDPDIEIVVVNDAATDDTAAVLESCRDPRLRVVTHQKNQGLPAARNTGFRASSGDYILPLDGDDIPCPESWPFLISSLQQNPMAVAAYGYRQMFVDGDSFVPRRNVRLAMPSGDILREITQDNFLTPGTVIVRRSAIAIAGGWDESLTIGEDWEMWCRLALGGAFVCCPGQLMLGYRIRKGSISRSPVYQTIPNMWRPVDAILSNTDIKRSLGEQYDDIERQTIARFYYRCAYNSWRQKKFMQAVVNFVASVRMSPLRLAYFALYPLRVIRRMGGGGVVV